MGSLMLFQLLTSNNVVDFKPDVVNFDLWNWRKQVVGNCFHVIGLKLKIVSRWFPRWRHLLNLLIWFCQQIKYLKYESSLHIVSSYFILYLADLGEGARRTPPPPRRVQILSFRHTNFLKCNHLGSPRPLRGPRPLREILDPLLVLGRFG